MQIEVQFANEPKQTFVCHKNVVTIGRSKNSDIQIIYPGISRVHMQVELIDGIIYVTDLGSTNGIIMDSVRLKVNEPTLYHEYFQISTGETNISITQEVVNEEVPTLSLGEHRSAHATASAAITVKEVTPKPGKNQYILPVAFTLISFTVAFFYYNSREAEISGVTNMQPASETKKIVPVAVKFEDNSQYYKLWDQSGCKTPEEKLLCGKLKKKWNEKESIIISENIYIFINLAEEIKSLNIPLEKADEMYQVLLSYYSTHPAIKTSEKKSFTIGFLEARGSSFLKLVVSHDPALLPELSPEQHLSIFSRAYIGEQHWFKKLILPILSKKVLD